MAFGAAKKGMGAAILIFGQAKAQGKTRWRGRPTSQ